MTGQQLPPLTLEAFEAADVDAERFDHEAHVYVGWLYLERFSLLDAIDRFTSALKRLTIKLGVAEKYHETISWFFLIMIEERRQSSDADSWMDFRAENDDLFRGRELLQRFYSDRCLQGALAKRSFVLPDLASNERPAKTSRILPRPD
jgi:hypothetical protein